MLSDITKSFGETEVLKGINIAIGRGEFITLLGPSGCGKTTTLRIIAGLESPDSGTVTLSGEDVTSLEPNKRNVNTVFQSYALFPHMNVFNNIAYGLKIKKMPKDEIAKKVQEMLELVQLDEYGKRMPEQLSGGQRQRVAIARAAINDPDILLLDEPLGALDLQLRRQMQVELKHMQQKLGMTFIYITHDQEEALNMSDRIVVMNEGEFEQIGTPEDIYERPQTRFAAQFIGSTNFIEAKVTGVNGEGLLDLDFADGKIKASAPEGEYSPGDELLISLRTERIRYGNECQNGFELSGKIKEHSYIGGTQRTTIELKNGQQIHVTGFRPEKWKEAGETVCVYWNPRHAHIVEGGVGEDDE